MGNAPGMFWRRTAGEPGHGEVETPPEKMDRAAFAAELGAELLEDPVALEQDAPETIGVFGVVGRIGFVLLKRDRRIDFVWCGVDPYRDIEHFEGLHDLPIESSD